MALVVNSDAVRSGRIKRNVATSNPEMRVPYGGGNMIETRDSFGNPQVIDNETYLSVNDIMDLDSMSEGERLNVINDIEKQKKASETLVRLNDAGRLGLLEPWDAKTLIIESLSGTPFDSPEQQNEVYVGMLDSYYKQRAQYELEIWGNRGSVRDYDYRLREDRLDAKASGLTTEDYNNRRAQFGSLFVEDAMAKRYYC